MKNKKLMKVIEIHSDLVGELANRRKQLPPDSLCKVALVQALAAVAKGTTWEQEVNDLIQTCEAHLFDE